MRAFLVEFFRTTGRAKGLLLFYDKNGYGNASEGYVIHTWAYLV